MKKFFYFLGLFMMASAVTNAQNVGTDRDLQSNLQNYKTYAWVKNIDRIPSDKIFVGPNGVLVFNNESTRSKIKEAIQYELDARGYKMNEANPDFYVNFMVLEQPTELTTYNGYQTINGGLDTVRTPENVQKTPVKAGTVLIDFIDVKTSKQVWQGFASGILNADMVNNRSDVRAAISSIFSQYRYRAPGNSK